jgi:malate synthase
VAHPGLVAIAMESFGRMVGENQIDRKREDVKVSGADLLAVPQPPTITEQGLRTNIGVGIRYMEAWLRGQGCVPINNLMEDAATAEISRAQLWQWVHHGSSLTDGRKVTRELVEQILDDEMNRIREQMGVGGFEGSAFKAAADLFRQMTASEQCPEFLTSVAYEQL